MPNLGQSSVSQSTTQEEDNFDFDFLPSTVEVIDTGLTPQEVVDPRIEANPVAQELPIPQQEINLMAKYDINRRELEEAYRIMNMLNERSQLNVTIDEAIRIYKNMPMYNQNLNIPFDQVSMINQTAFPALSGRTNVLNSRGQEL